MTAKIKLNAASGGGSFSLQAPSSSSNNRVFTLPDSADATLLTSTSSVGKVLQVKHAFKNDAFSDSSGNFAAITGLSVTITAASTSNKLLFVCNLMYGQATQAVFIARLYDGTSEITASRSTVSSTAIHNGWISDYMNDSSASGFLSIASGSYLHTPADTNSHTYNIYACPVDGGAFYINRRGSDTSFGGTSSFYVYEVST